MNTPDTSQSAEFFPAISAVCGAALLPATLGTLDGYDGNFWQGIVLFVVSAVCFAPVIRTAIIGTATINTLADAD